MVSQNIYVRHLCFCYKNRTGNSHSWDIYGIDDCINNKHCEVCKKREKMNGNNHVNWAENERFIKISIKRLKPKTRRPPENTGLVAGHDSLTVEKNRFPNGKRKRENKDYNGWLKYFIKKLRVRIQPI